MAPTPILDERIFPKQDPTVDDCGENSVSLIAGKAAQPASDARYAAMTPKRLLTHIVRVILLTLIILIPITMIILRSPQYLDMRNEREARTLCNAVTPGQEIQQAIEILRPLQIRMHTSTAIAMPNLIYYVWDNNDGGHTYCIIDKHLGIVYRPRVEIHPLYPQI